MAEEAAAVEVPAEVAAPPEVEQAPVSEPTEPAPAPPAEPAKAVDNGAPKPAGVSNASVNISIETSAKRTPDSVSRTTRKEESIRKIRISRDFNRRSTKASKYYASMMSIKRGSFASFQERSKAPKFMNSYRLDAEKPFNIDKVHSIIVSILKEQITDDLMYDESIAEKTKTICTQIRNKIKEQAYDRYKILVLTTIGEKKSYDICSVVRFLWDQERDKLAHEFAENMYLFCTASAYGIYKLICLVTIGEKKSHDIFTGVRFLWDAERDKFATYMHDNMFLFAVATVFGLYYE